MKKAVIGILAHVDSGKTTLSEALLYNSGMIKKLGRVDHKDAFLDTDNMERDRGITIFSHQAVLKTDRTEITLLDTPGHVDFSAETERVLGVLDYAILVINGAEGVQSHTETLWKLLEIYNIPIFIFVNKTDIAQRNNNDIIKELNHVFGGGCIDFSKKDEAFFEEAAVSDKKLMEEYFGSGTISDESLKETISQRKIFPCFFGSALKNDGVCEFLSILEEYTEEIKYSDAFGAKVFKINEDDKGKRLTFLKVTGGSLKVKSLVNDEKINELRIYSGNKFNSVSEIKAGEVCAAVGLCKTFPGQGLGFEENEAELVTEPVFKYSVKLPDGVDVAQALPLFKKLAEEETKLCVSLNNLTINVKVMGEVQLEVIKQIFAERFGMNIEFEQGSIIYKETIKGQAEGIGHYEPLKHYAEVHLLLEEGKRGSGIVIASKCGEDILDRNYQHLILTHIAEKTHIGVLCGFPVTDIKITLINGKAHKKHTEGGDFRQATYRAVRNGLMLAESVLLEPYYNFTLKIPTETCGRAMTDLEMLGADFSAPETEGDITVIKGSAPIAGICEYQKDVTAYTRGRGRLSCIFKGYEECSDSNAVIEKIGYRAENDVENTADSVFCKNGGGFSVKWNEVAKYAHIPPMSEKKEAAKPAVHRQNSLIADEEELLRIFESTYGKVQRKTPKLMKTEKKPTAVHTYKNREVAEEYLLIDGYNIIFAWDELNKLAEESLEDARILLIDKVCNYHALNDENIILVFDAYKVSGSVREVENIHGVSVVYTKEAETADAYIEKATKSLCKKYRVKVATSDNLEQMIIFGHGAVRVSALEFKEKIENSERKMRELMKT